MAEAAHTYRVQFMAEYDPTRTLTLRNRFAKEAKRRWKKLNRILREAILTDDCFGLDPATSNRGMVLNAVPTGSFGTGSQPEKMRKFFEWLERQEAIALIAGPGMADVWTDQYVDQAYRQGVTRARSEMIRAGYDVPTMADSGGVDASMMQAQHIDRSLVMKMSIQDDLNSGISATNNTLGRLLANKILEPGADRALLADQVTKILTGLLPDVPMKEINERFVAGMRRTVIMGRTGIVKAHHWATIQEYQTWGVEGGNVMAEWETAEDERVCDECAAMAKGGPYPLDQAIYLIPRHPNCVSGDSVVIAPDMTGIMTSNYSGQIIKLTLANGACLTVTPQHVLCTPDGFVMARFLSNGDDLLYSGLLEREIFNDPNYNRDDLRIDNIIKTFSEYLGMPTRTVPGSPENFHGDAVFCDKDINIVGTASLLENGINTGLVEHFGSKNFSTISVLDVFSRFCSLASLLNRAFSPFGGSVGLSREFLSFFRGCLSHAQKHGLAPIPGGDIVFFKNSDYDIASNHKFFSNFFDRVPVVKHGDDFFSINVELARQVVAASCCESEFNEPVLHGVALLDSDRASDSAQAFSGQVSSVKIVNVDVCHVDSFPVYDVSTMATIYSVNGVMSSNCRCVFLPIRVEK